MTRTRATEIALVFIGGAIGTALRLIAVSLAPAASEPTAVFVVNVIGAFLIGVLVESLVRQGQSYRTRRKRLFLSTGVLGGFTTYSALATDTVLFVAGGDLPAALLYSAGTVVVGFLSTFVGVIVGSRIAPTRSDLRES